MNKIKFIVAIFAVAFVIVGSAFSPKFTDTLYGNLNQNRILVSGQTYKYTVTDLSIHPGTCTTLSGAICKKGFDLSRTSEITVGTPNPTTGVVDILVDESIGGYIPSNNTLNKKFQ